MPGRSHQEITQDLASASGPANPDRQTAPGENAAPQATGLFPPCSLAEGLSKIDFAEVRDDAPFRTAEKDAWFGIWRLLRSCSSNELWRLQVIPVTFSQLYRRPRDYRGKLVEVRGRIAGVFPVGAPPNDLGIKSYFQLWLCPEQEADPIVVYCLAMPTGFPTGEKLAEPAVIRGVFFKRWPYQAKDGLRFAPVVLAPSISWEKPHVATSLPSAAPPNVLWAAVIACLLTVLFLWYILKVRERTTVLRRGRDRLLHFGKRLRPTD